MPKPPTKNPTWGVWPTPPWGERHFWAWDGPADPQYDPVDNRGFTGHEHLDPVGLIHMNGRVYDPELGRFLSPDPFVQAPLNTQSYNRYSYVFNNPLSYTDPSGYTSEKSCGYGTVNNKCAGGLDEKDTQRIEEQEESKHAGITVVTGYRSEGRDSNATHYRFQDWSVNSGRYAGGAQEGIRIDIGYTDAVGHGLHGQHHALVIITDPATGQQYAVRAGPSGGLGSSQSAGNSAASGSGGSVSATAGNGGSGGHGLGSIYAEHGIYNETFRDAPGAVHRIQHVGYLNSSFDNVRAMAVDFSNVTNANRLPYRPLTLNSNSFAFTFVESLGFSRPTPVIGAPGWQNGAVSSSLSYP